MLQGPIVRSTIRTSAVLGLRLGVQAGTLLLAARMLGTQQFGVFAGVAALAVLLGTLSTFGTHFVLLGEMSKEPLRREAVLSYAIPCTLLCGAILLSVYLLVCSGLPNAQSIPIYALFLIGIVEIILQPLLTLMVGEHHALGRVARSQLLQLLPLALRLLAAATIVLLHLSQPISAYAMAYLLASVLALGIGSFTLQSAWPGMQEWRKPTRDERRQAFGYATSNLTRAGPAELDKALAMHLLAANSAGVYAAGARVIGGVFLPITAMTLAALPRLFRETRSVDGGRLLTWMFGSALIYSLCLAALLWFTAPLFSYVFGHGYEGVSEVIRWLCLAVPGLALRLVAGNALISMGRPLMRAGFETTGIIALTITAILFSAELDWLGLVVALICSEWTMAFVGIILTLHERIRR